MPPKGSIEEMHVLKFKIYNPNFGDPIKRPLNDTPGTRAHGVSLRLGMALNFYMPGSRFTNIKTLSS